MDIEEKDAPINPLLKFSLSGMGDQLQERAIAQKPLLDDLCLSGEISVWYAPPNAGKTLATIHMLLEAVASSRVAAGNVFYVNTDDSTAGVAAKVQLLDDYGIHCLAESERGFRASHLIPAMEEMIANKSASGAVIVLDTLKKFTDLMSKKESAEFGKVARRFAMANGTMLALAHTNKHRGTNSKLIYAGTSDINEDSDSCYLIDIHSEDTEQRIIHFQCIKNRGGTAREAFYTYSIEPGLRYDQRLASFERIDRPVAHVEEDESHREAFIIACIEKAIQHGNTQKMQLLRCASLAAKVSRRAVLKVLDTYCGTDANLHQWTFDTRDRGAKIYRLLSEPQVSIT